MFEGIYGQLFWVSIYSTVAAAVTLLVMIASRKKVALNMALFVLGLLVQLFWSHFKAYVSPLGGGSLGGPNVGSAFEFSLLYFALGGLLGFAMTRWAPISRIFKPHKHSHHCKSVEENCSHAEKSQGTFATIWLLGLIPHSVADGVFWGLSLGFTPVFAREVFLFLIIHRSIEMASWVGLLYSRFKYRKRIVGFVVLSIVSFLIGALVTVQMGPEFWPYKDHVAKVLLLTLGYLVFLAFSEVRLMVSEQFSKQNLRKKVFVAPLMYMLLGILAANYAFKIVKIFE